MDIKNKSLHQKQREIAELSTRGIPIAIQQTLTATARHAWRYGRANTESMFQTRNNWSVRSQRFTRAEGLNVERMVAITGSSAQYMADQEEGFTRQAKGKAGIWVPTAEAAGQTGKRTRPVIARLRKGRIRLRKKAKRKASSPAQQQLFNMYNAVMTNGFFWGTMNNTTGMWKLSGTNYKGKLLLNSVKLLYSANKRINTTEPHKWHSAGVADVIGTKEYEEYDKALNRQLRRLKAKYK